MKWMLILMLGCTVEPPSKPQETCKEFDYLTVRDQDAIVCRMLWCEIGPNSGIHGGPTKLWCKKK